MERLLDVAMLAGITAVFFFGFAFALMTAFFPINTRVTVAAVIAIVAFVVSFILLL